LISSQEKKEEKEKENPHFWPRIVSNIWGVSAPVDLEYVMLAITQVGHSRKFIINHVRKNVGYFLFICEKLYTIYPVNEDSYFNMLHKL